MLHWVENETAFDFDYSNIYEEFKFHNQLSMIF